MVDLSLSLPESLRDFAEEQVARGCYAGPGDYIRELLVQARKRRDEERLEAILIAGLDSGDPVEFTPEYRSKKESEFLARHRAVEDR
ncbi:MAG: type II toxin-antitoxin system ParD family antitoxin [Armatimonadetes bacterium]|nr:type II toxin-antitoxin system ParD family antitoxin [Armatimonadota bacterium]